MQHLPKNLGLNRGLFQHLNFCRRQNSNEQQTDIKPEIRSNHMYEEQHNDGDQETKEGFTGTMLPAHGLKFLLMMYMKR